MARNSFTRVAVKDGSNGFHGDRAATASLKQPFRSQGWAKKEEMVYPGISAGSEPGFLEDICVRCGIMTNYSVFTQKLQKNAIPPTNKRIFFFEELLGTSCQGTPPPVRLLLYDSNQPPVKPLPPLTQQSRRGFVSLQDTAVRHREELRRVVIFIAFSQFKHRLITP